MALIDNGREGFFSQSLVNPRGTAGCSSGWGVSTGCSSAEPPGRRRFNRENVRRLGNRDLLPSMRTILNLSFPLMIPWPGDEEYQ